MTVFAVKFKFVDERGFNTIRTFRTKDIVGADIGAEFNTASQHALALRTDLALMSSATITEVAINVLVNEDSTAPLSGSGVHENAVMNLFLDADGRKLSTVRIPSPKTSAFLADGKTLNTSQGDVQNVVSEIATNFTISDGENVDTAQGDNGLQGGYWASQSKK